MKQVALEVVMTSRDPEIPPRDEADAGMTRKPMLDESGQLITDVWIAYEKGYRNGGSSVEADWEIAIDDAFDLDVDWPQDACDKLKKLMTERCCLMTGKSCFLATD